MGLSFLSAVEEVRKRVETTSVKELFHLPTIQAYYDILVFADRGHLEFLVLEPDSLDEL